MYVVLTNSAGYFYSPKESYISLIVQQGIASESVAPTIDHMIITRKDLDYDIEFIDDSKKYSADEVSMASSQVMISPVYAYLGHSQLKQHHLRSVGSDSGRGG